MPADSSVILQEVNTIDKRFMGESPVVFVGEPPPSRAVPVAQAKGLELLAAEDGGRYAALDAPPQSHFGSVTSATTTAARALPAAPPQRIRVPAAPGHGHALAPLATPETLPAPVQAAPGEPIWLARVLGALFWKPDLWLFAAVFVGVFAWMAIYAFSTFQPLYTSRATVLIKDSAITANYVLPGQTAALQTTSSNAANPVLNMIGLLSSSQIRDALWASYHQKHPDVLKTLKIKTKAQWDQFYGDGKALIKAKNLPGTDLIQLEYTWFGANTAQSGLATVVKAFQDASLALNQVEQRHRSDYLARQVRVITQKLDAVRKQKSGYKSASGTVNLLRESDDLARSRIETETLLAQTLARAQSRSEELLRYRRMLGGVSAQQALSAAGMGLNPSLSKLQDQLYTLNTQLANLRSSLTDNHPRVMETQAQIGSVRKGIQAEVLRVLGKKKSTGGLVVADPTRAQVISQMATSQAEAEGLRAQAGVLQGRLAALHAKARAFPKIEQGLTRLEQEERSLSTALDTLRQKELEAELKRAETMSNVFVVDAPNLPFKAKFPDRPHLLVLGAVLGLLAGLLALFVKRRLMRPLGTGHTSVGFMWLDLPAILESWARPPGALPPTPALATPTLTLAGPPSPPPALASTAVPMASSAPKTLDKQPLPTSTSSAAAFASPLSEGVPPPAVLDNDASQGDERDGEPGNGTADAGPVSPTASLADVVTSLDDVDSLPAVLTLSDGASPPGGVLDDDASQGDERDGEAGNGTADAGPVSSKTDAPGTALRVPA
jgi:uncharacterized protein involved in exopolysaccharide biosynthesis